MDIDKFTRQVKYNCNVADAQSWGYYSICGLLLRIRGLYRHEHAMKPWQNIPMDAAMSWVESREALWAELGEKTLRDIEINGKYYGPFEVDSINDAINDNGFVYGGGYGLFHKPTFFFARLRQKKSVGDFHVFYAEDELCRDISTSIAMLQDKNIFIRLEQLRAFLLEKFHELQGRKSGGILEHAFSHYEIEKGEPVSEKLYEKIKDVSFEVIDILTAHEIGEAREDEITGNWISFLMNNNDKFLELYIRGIKDLLADTSESGTIKMILERKSHALLSFFIIMLDGIRKELFPEMLDAYQRFMESNDWRIIEDARRSGYRRASALRYGILGLLDGEEGIEDIKDFIRPHLGEKASGKLRGPSQSD
ncbi:hypothetical protein BMS3Abin07_01086 [bacterium BMS3Abin07]|nr:hypothetical protein BMS3Abin07_01086 [bacterium BMS3Abin07]HDO23211.1 hypothetical protein [Nitrospirota bacterium]